MSIAPDQAPSASEEVYRLSAGPYRDGQLLVCSFQGREALSRLYRFDIVITSAMLDDTLERTLLGQRAMLSLHLGRVERSFHGIISGIEAQGLRGSEGQRLAQHRLRLVPRAWLLTRRKGSRIFQDMRVDQVIDRVLRDAGIPSRFRLQHRYPVRSYCTQYAETDLDFIARLAAECGLFFYFEQPHDLADGPEPAFAAAAVSLAGGLADELGRAAGSALGGEVMVFGDHALAYPSLDDDAPGAPLDRLAGSVADCLIGAARSAAGSPLGGLISSAGEAGELASQAASALGLPDDLPGELLRASLGQRAPAPPLRYRESEALIAPSEDSITTFSARRALRAASSAYREFDPERPQTIFSATAPPGGGGVVSAISSLAGAALSAAAPGLGSAASGAVSGLGAALPLGDRPAPGMEVYEHHGRDLFPDWHYAHDEPRRILDQNRRRSHVARGSSLCARLHPGRRFVLEDHPQEHLNIEYAVTSVEHRGVARPSASEPTRPAVYRNTFACVPADLPFVPARPPHRVVQSCLTATVVGPPGEDIHVNARGEIKVRFHWDRAGRGADSSCWIRTMHAWGGTGWGTQHIPRVGMEVVVSFDAGDPDRPLVLGCVYNATHPSAFPLPAQKTRSGIRTRSSPDRQGFNELSFDDAAGLEQIYLHAQRDFDSDVQRDRTARIQRDDRSEVQHDQATIVNGAQRTRVAGDRATELGSDDHLRVEGTRHVSVQGDAHERVAGERTVRVEGRDRREIVGERVALVHGDLVSEVRGAATMLVGRNDEKRACTLVVEGVTQLSGSEIVDLSSDTELVLRCGKSTIRLGPEEIEISSPRVTVRGKDARLLLQDGKAKLKAKALFQVVSEDKIILKSSGASLGLGAEAKLDGAKVLFNSPEQATDEIEVHEPEVTTIELVDQDDRPIPYQRFELHLDDGSRYSGFLDGDGKAEVDIEGAGKVIFPDRPELEPA